MMHSSTTVMTVRDIPQSLAYYRDRTGLRNSLRVRQADLLCQACAAAACACAWSRPTARRGSPATAPRLSPSMTSTGCMPSCRSAVRNSQGAGQLRLRHARFRCGRSRRQHALLRDEVRRRTHEDRAAVRLFVEDVPAAQAFYADLLGGLKPLSLEPATLVFRPRGALLIVEQADAEARAEGLVGRFAGLSFDAPDIERLHKARPEQAVPLSARPSGRFRGGILMHVRDPSGNIVSFVPELDGNNRHGTLAIRRDRRRAADPHGVAPRPRAVDSVMGRLTVNPAINAVVRALDEEALAAAETAAPPAPRRSAGAAARRAGHHQGQCRSGRTANRQRRRRAEGLHRDARTARWWRTGACRRHRHRPHQHASLFDAHLY